VPFLRVIRDKRGYETTYLMHWYREGARQRSRILYVFRSPGGVHVGRASLDPEVQRDLEAQHPDIVFDWKAVFDNKQLVESTPEMRRPRKRRRGEEEPAAAPPLPAQTAAAAAPADDQSARTEGADRAHGQASDVRPARTLIPAAIEGATPDEQTAFLTQWYPVVRDRIPQRTADPARREALLALAERMNPAAWTDADQIAAGLQQASEALERLSHVFARRRRRSRRARGPERTSASTVEHAAPGPELHRTMHAGDPPHEVELPDEDEGPGEPPTSE
jgi:hypothetical protein